MEATKKSNSNKDHMLRIRVNEDTLNKLDRISEIKGINRSKIVRELIEKEFESIKK